MRVNSNLKAKCSLKVGEKISLFYSNIDKSLGIDLIVVCFFFFSYLVLDVFVNIECLIRKAFKSLLDL